MLRDAVILIITAGMVYSQDTSCTIAGTISDARSGAPIEKATVILTPASGGQPRVFDSISDAAGKFLLNAITRGEYRVTATAEGHAPSVVAVKCTGASRGVNFVLNWQGVIAGRVLDQDGRGVAGASVALLRPVYRGGTKRLLIATRSIADADGQFRLVNLPAGTYYLSATVPSSGVDSGGQVSVTTFYPGTLESYAAAPIVLAGTAEMTSADIRVVKTRAAKVGGRLLAGAVETSLRDYTVRLAPADLRSPGPQFTIRDDKGHFQFAGVTPGSYTLVAFKDAGQPVARTKIDVGDRDVDGVELLLSAGNAVTGRLTLEGKQQDTAPAARIDLQSWEDLPLSAAVNVRGNEFTLAGIAPAMYRIAVTATRQTYARALRVDGRDVPDWIADLTAAHAHTIDIVLGADAGRVTGYARDSSGNPRPKTIVTLAPAGNGPLTVPQYATAVSDDQGRYLFAGVQPGAYKVYAWEDAGPPGLVQNRQILSQFETQCADVTIPPNGAANADVTAIAASAVAALE